MKIPFEDNVESAISLSQLVRQMTAAIEAKFGDPLWVTAEVSECRTAAGGHCYLSLVEKSRRSERLVAQMRATCWANRWRLLSQHFYEETGQPFGPGLKVLLLVKPTLHEVYGLSVDVLDIDPTYTLGEMARRRREIIRRLTDEGLTELQATLPFPLLPQRVAVVSAPSAAGYGDFCHQLEHNEAGLRFYTHLFPAVMQGQQTEPSVLEALDDVERHAALFDVVVIIRGGGSVSDLASFDSYRLAARVARFPLPVITGIGHDRDQTVVDLVAYASVKTPTAAAAMLVDQMGQQYARVLQLSRDVAAAVRGQLDRQRGRLGQLALQAGAVRVRIERSRAVLSLLGQRISLATTQRIERERQRHEFFSSAVEFARPDHILARGFSIVRAGGKMVKAADEVQPGTLVEAQTAHGSFMARVENLKIC